MPQPLIINLSLYVFVMPGLGPGIHGVAPTPDVDGRAKPGHDGDRRE
jgi:hypothetical protein